jgi:hypothetical protein
MAPPTIGPSRIAPMMAGMCMMVTDVPVNHGRKPQRVSPRMIAMALSAPVMAILRVQL